MVSDSINTCIAAIWINTVLLSFVVRHVMCKILYGHVISLGQIIFSFWKKWWL
jgi:hypothetical protein